MSPVLSGLSIIIISKVFYLKSDYTKFSNFNMQKIFFWVNTPRWCMDMIPRKEGEYMFGCLSYIYPNRRFLIENPLASKPARKIEQKVCSVNSTHWKNTLNYFWSNALGEVKNLTNLLNTILANSCPHTENYFTCVDKMAHWTNCLAPL
jgi:hypothetical protein